MTDSSNFEHLAYRAEDLLQRYFDQTVTREEAAELLQIWSQHRGIAQAALKQYEINHLMQFLVRMEKERQKQFTCVPLPSIDSPFVGETVSRGMRIVDFTEEFMRLEAESKLIGDDVIFSHTALEDLFKSLPVVDGNLSDEWATERPKTPPKEIEAQRFSIYQISLFLVILSIMVVGVYSELIGFRKANPKTSESVAVISECIDVEWDENEPFKSGRRIGMEKIKWSRGVVKIDFDNKAELVLEGPAEIVVDKASGMTCYRGKLNAFVPKSAHGFEVMTPFTTVRDLGTEFSVIVDDATTDLHVLSGLVDVYQDTKSRFSLSQGNAIRTYGNKTMREIELDKNACIDRDACTALADAQREQRILRREDYDKRFLRDPKTMLLFDGKTFRIRRDKSLSSGAQTHGGVPAMGAFSIGDARHIRKKSDHLTFTLPGKFSSLSTVFYIKINDLDQSGTLFQGRDFSFRLDENGSVRILAGREEYVFKEVVSKNEFGTWTLFGITVDVASKKISFYKDGRSVASDSWDSAAPITIGECFLGNSPNGPSGRIDAAIDEVLLFDRVLSEEEMNELYDCLN